MFLRKKGFAKLIGVENSINYKFLVYSFRWTQPGKVRQNLQSTRIQYAVATSSHFSGSHFSTPCILPK